MRKLKILKVRLGNNPTSSATTYQLFPDIYAAVKVTMWIAWALLGAGGLAAVAALARVPRARQAGNDTSVRGAVAAGLVFIARNLKPLFKMTLMTSLACIPLNIVLAVSALVVLDGSQASPGIQIQFMLLLYILMFSISPAWIIGGAVAEKLKTGRSSMNIEKTLSDNKDSIVRAAVLAVSFAVFMPFLIRRPGVSIVYGSPSGTEPMRAVGVFSANLLALLFCLALISFLSAVFVVQVIKVAGRSTIIDWPSAPRVCAAFIISLGLNAAAWTIMILAFQAMILVVMPILSALGGVPGPFEAFFELLAIPFVFSVYFAVTAGAVIPAISIIFACLSPSELEYVRVHGSCSEAVAN